MPVSKKPKKPYRKKMRIGRLGLQVLGRHKIQLDDDGIPVGYPWDYNIPTLGDEAVMWGEEVLLTPMAKKTGSPLVLQPWQRRWTAWFYALDLEPGEQLDEDEAPPWLFGAGQLILAKGIGKSPFAAFLCLFEWAGPCRFSHWDEDEPVGMPDPLPQVGIAANAEKQSRNTFKNVKVMLEGSLLEAELGNVEIGAKRIRRMVAAGEALIEMLTAGGASLEGVEFTFCILDESQYATKRSGGHDLVEKLEGNLGKKDGRMVETTNVWIPGQDSIAELTNEQVEDERAGRTQNVAPVLQFWRQILPSPDLSNAEELEEHLKLIYDEAPWIRVKSVIAKIYSRKLSVIASRRLYLNELTAADLALVTPQMWDAAATAKPLEDGDRITLGFDGSEGDDYTVLVAMRVDDRSLHLLGAWKADDTRDRSDPLRFDKEAIAGAVVKAFNTYKVAAACFDLAYWDGWVRGWERDFGSQLEAKAGATPMAWDMRQSDISKKTAQHHELFLGDLERGEIIHSGDRTLRQHALNARARWHGEFRSFGKETRGSTKKIDAYAGAIMADIARSNLLSGTKTGKPKSRLRYAR